MLDPGIKTGCRSDRDCNPGRVCSAASQCVERDFGEESDAESASTGGELGGASIAPREMDESPMSNGVEKERTQEDAGGVDAATPAPTDAGDVQIDRMVEAGADANPVPQAATRPGDGSVEAPDAIVNLAAKPMEPGVDASCACEAPEAHVRWSFPANERGFYNIDQVVAVRSELASVAWFEDVYFVGESDIGARIGFESRGVRPDGSIGKVAVFSMYGATGAEGTHCEVSTEPAPMTTCRAAFDFIPGHHYVWRIWKTSDEMSLWWWWGAWVLDAEGVSEQVNIGALRGPPGRTFIQHTDNGVHYNDARARCDAPRPSSAHFSAPLVDASNSRAQTMDLGEDVVTSCRAAEVKLTAGGIDVTFGAP